MPAHAFVEFPKMLHRAGKKDVRVLDALEEEAALARWDEEDGVQATKPVNALTQAPLVAFEYDTGRTVDTPPAEPREQQLAVSIPEDWRDLPYLPRVSGAPSLKSLAAKVSSTPITDKASAVAAIEVEVERRKAGV